MTLVVVVATAVLLQLITKTRKNRKLLYQSDVSAIYRYSYVEQKACASVRTLCDERTDNRSSLPKVDPSPTTGGESAHSSVVSHIPYTFKMLDSIPF